MAKTKKKNFESLLNIYRIDKNNSNSQSFYQNNLKESRPKFSTVQPQSLNPKQLRRSFLSKSTVSSSVSHNIDSKENVEFYNGDTFGKNQWAKSTFEIRSIRNMKKSQSVDPTHKDYISESRDK